MRARRSHDKGTRVCLAARGCNCDLAEPLISFLQVHLSRIAVEGAGRE